MSLDRWARVRVRRQGFVSLPPPSERLKRDG